MSFAGSTDVAYPMMLQLANSIAFYPPSAERRLDLAQLSGHALRLFNQMRGLVNGPFAVGHDEPGPPGALFVLGGYSWRYQAFFAWSFSFGEGVFASTRVVRGWPGRSGWRFHFSGDTDVVEHARERTFTLLRAPGRERIYEDGLDMEPFEVLRDVIREQRFESVGGAPQLGKVYRHLNTQFFGVEWDGGLSVAGRPALPDERAFVPVLDPDNLELQHPLPAAFQDAPEDDLDAPAGTGD
jgi:hypothetical protein